MANLRWITCELSRAPEQATSPESELESRNHSYLQLHSACCSFCSLNVPAAHKPHPPRPRCNGTGEPLASFGRALIGLCQKRGNSASLRRRCTWRASTKNSRPTTQIFTSSTSCSWRFRSYAKSQLATSVCGRTSIGTNRCTYFEATWSFIPARTSPVMQTALKQGLTAAEVACQKRKGSALWMYLGSGRATSEVQIHNRCASSQRLSKQEQRTSSRNEPNSA
jgi:hypothetical protein